MAQDVDVAIVGGGPAGLAAAAAAATGGLRVVVHERNGAIGEPVRTSGGSFVEPLRRLGVPDDCWHPVHTIRVIGPTTDVAKHYRTPVGCVLDVRRTYQWLGARAVDAGAEIRLKSHVDGLRRDETGRVVGLRARDPFRGRYDVDAAVVVDASGHTGFLARDAGLRPGNERSAVGMEIELRAPGYDQDQAVFWLGDAVAPGGYGWAFPTGEGRVRLGVGVVRPESDAEPRELLDRLLTVFQAHAGGPGAPAGALEMHSGLMPVLAPTATQLVADRMLVVGDAGGQGSTLLGEGIRYAITAGRMAGEALVAAGGDYTASGLAAYSRSWHRRMKRDMAISYAVNTRICNFRDEDWDRAVRRMEQLTAKQAARLFASDFSVSWAMGVLVTHPSLLRSVGRALRQRV
ncbi:MAG TPA: NAD(P)/FAD-dependent oxidoreductase [Mycobacteriales bacterium]|nr:NAD(P)/FAD-dependent oxidoreductase [Mycobacteriales bacterium]